MSELAEKDSKPFELNQQIIHPGERATIVIDTPKLYDWTETHMPVHVVHGKKAGPVLVVTGTIHGDEINSVEVVRRLMKRKELDDIAGTLVTVPIVNMYGFISQSRYLPDRRDLNRFFPGSEKGSLALRLADILMQRVICKATHLIDMHTGAVSRFNIPQVRGDMSIPGVRQMAEAFNPLVIMDQSVLGGSIREAADKKGIPSILYEAGEALRFDELSITLGVEGILNVMTAIGMCAEPCTKPRAKAPTALESYWLRAPKSGILLTSTNVGDSVSKDDLIATIANPVGVEEFTVKVPISGLVIGKTNLPLVHAGTAVFHIATYEKLQEAQKHLENVQMEFDAGKENQY